MTQENALRLFKCLSESALACIGTSATVPGGVNWLVQTASG